MFRNVTPTGFGTTSRHILENLIEAVWLFMNEFYHGEVSITVTLTKTERNERIRTLYSNGHTIPELAVRYNLSNVRIHQIIHNRRK